MNSNIPPEARRVLDAIRRLVRSLRVYSRKIEGHLGLSAAQVFVLQELSEAEHATLKDLARRTMTDVSSVSVVVERLVRKGLVLRKRAAHDGRRLDLELSPQGREVLAKEPHAVQSRIIEAVSALKPAQRRSLAGQLEALLKNAGMAHEEAAMLFEPEKHETP
jgi:DNA-binding MarR family transcriptional regulator